jgi:hypothetical protein
MSPIDLLALPLGLLIGFAVAALGAGGSLLTLPLLVGLLGVTPYAATTASLIITGTTAGTGLVRPARERRVAWGAGAVLAVLGIPSAWLGARWAAGADPSVLLGGFAIVVLLAAIALALRGKDTGLDDQIASRVLRCPAWTWCRAFEVLRWITVATVVGLLTGVFGVGGGFLVVPALVLVAHLPMRVAVGTSLLVIAANSVVGLLARAGTPVDWSLVGPLAVAGAIGALLGGRWAASVHPQRLQQALTVALVLVAGWAISKAVWA